jgi:hypothetical protein
VPGGGGGGGQVHGQLGVIVWCRRGGGAAFTATAAGHRSDRNAAAMASKVDRRMFGSFTSSLFPASKLRLSKISQHIIG